MFLEFPPACQQWWFLEDLVKSLSSGLDCSRNAPCPKACPGRHPGRPTWALYSALTPEETAAGGGDGLHCSLSQLMGSDLAPERLGDLGSGEECHRLSLQLSTHKMVVWITSDPDLNPGLVAPISLSTWHAHDKSGVYLLEKKKGKEQQGGRGKSPKNHMGVTETWPLIRVFPLAFREGLLVRSEKLIHTHLYTDTTWCWWRRWSKEKQTVKRQMKSIEHFNCFS